MRPVGMAARRRTREGIIVERLWGPPKPHHLQPLKSQGLTRMPPPPKEPEALERTLPRLDALPPPGSGDLDPSPYGKEPCPRLEEVSPKRNRNEAFLPRYGGKGAFRAKNVALGGNLCQDLEARDFREVRPSRGLPVEGLVGARMLPKNPVPHPCLLFSGVVVLRGIRTGFQGIWPWGE
ncbi:gamma-glutamyl-gamma-aminobutyrate hydrolase family protein [Thermus albus]|uniref:gamma-glutamyl-gamma-aminobutyrate hydrolase family protein n=1 Tax=Thermus albus TaxID=2908146 RepID=UPI003C12C0EF